MRERGLKQTIRGSIGGKHKVAPHAGAWIETGGQTWCDRSYTVAPHAGAWIETADCVRVSNIQGSLPMRERGLKHKVRTPGNELRFGRSPCGSVD